MMHGPQPFHRTGKEVETDRGHAITTLTPVEIDRITLEMEKTDRVCIASRIPGSG